MNADEAMALYAQGHQAAFEIVYEVVAPRIEGYVRRKVRDSSRVEDIVQQTFENMHKARGRFIPGSDVLNWAFAIARNLVIDTGKKAGRESSADMSEENESMGAVLAAAVAGGEELFLARETGALLVRTFGRLTKLQQEVFELVKLEGLSYQQAAATLGITVPSVRMYVHRAHLSLREALGDDPLPEPPAVAA
jgi:RNA polymerase sigma-70 factor (ECF subfamily)